MPKCKLIVGDCRDVLRRSGHKGKYDFAFADPPFNIGQAYEGFSDRVSSFQYEVFTIGWVNLLWESLKPDGIMALHGPDALCETYLRIIHDGMVPKPKRIAWVNWHYRFGQCNRSNWIDSRCHCLIYARNPKKWTWNPDVVLVGSDRRDKYNDSRIHEHERGGTRLPFTVWGVESDGPFWGRVQGNSKERRGHSPNQLPEFYLARLIRAYTNAGDTVIDPFCGSGTSATVATGLKRNAVTIDISRETLANARERIKQGPKRII
jgi:DNA modification methylase